MDGKALHLKWLLVWQEIGDGYISARDSLVSVPDPNPPQHGSHLVSRAGREGLVNLLHKN